MDPQYKSRFNDAILDEAIRRYAAEPASIQAEDGFESFIYAFSRGGQDYILRIGHAHRRNETLIHGEVDWINYLAAHGTSVARAVESAQGNLVEPLADGQGDFFLATAFCKAPGRPPSRAVQEAPSLWETYGRLLGRMHALARDYRPSSPAWARPHWDDPIMLSVEELLPPGESRAVERYQALREELSRLPRTDPAAYGMIHQDAHPGNFFVDDQGRITLFDFDDCCYSWYANDIAIVLFYMVTGRSDPAGFTRDFFPRFMHGYRRENTLDPAWLAEIPRFLKLREIDLYAVIHRSFDVSNLTDRWVAGFMRDRKARIEAGLPYIDYDFSQSI